MLIRVALTATVNLDDSPDPNERPQKISSELEARNLRASQRAARWSCPEGIPPLFRLWHGERGTQQLTACKRKEQYREGAKNRMCQWEERLPSALTRSGGGPVSGWETEEECRGQATQVRGLVSFLKSRKR